MKFVQALVLLIAVQACFAFASTDAEALSALAPLEELQELPEAGLPTDHFDQSAFEAFDLTSELEMDNAQQPEGYSLIEGAESEASAEQSSEQQLDQNGFPVVIPVGVAVRKVQIPVVHGEQAREMEFARIQYLQAAIAAKREAIAQQRQALANEEAQIRREKKLVQLNRAILARNEAQINRAQQELARLVESYSAGLRAGFKIDDAIEAVNPIVAVPRPVITVPVVHKTRKAKTVKATKKTQQNLASSPVKKAKDAIKKAARKAAEAAKKAAIDAAKKAAAEAAKKAIKPNAEAPKVETPAAAPAAATPAPATPAPAPATPAAATPAPATPQAMVEVDDNMIQAEEALSEAEMDA